ncbi:MAG: hypothetical protein ACLPXT_11520 [Terracidiphilus sp.]
MSRLDLKGNIDKGKADNSLRIQIITMLHEKAANRMIHADTFRQRNMNYALAIFAGLVVAGIRPENKVPHYVLSIMLTVLMILFTFWDNRLHKFSHGWRTTSSNCLHKLEDLVNDPNQKINICTYDSKGEKGAKWYSLQPFVYYLLVVASVASFWVLGK